MSDQQQSLNSTSTEVSRRHFLMGLGGLGGFLAFNSGMCNIMDLLGIEASADQTDDSPNEAPNTMPGVAQIEGEVLSRDGDQLILGAVGNFPPASVTHYRRSQDGRFYLMRFPDGGFLAISRRCTHSGCAVPWENDDAKFICRCHGSVFDSTGDVLAGPAPRPLDLYAISFVDGNVEINIGTPIERESVSPTDLVYA